MMQYRVNYEGRISDRALVTQKRHQGRHKKEQMGYIVEMAIRTHAADMKSGTTMGIEFQVNDERDQHNVMQSQNGSTPRMTRE